LLLSGNDSSGKRESDVFVEHLLNGRTLDIFTLNSGNLKDLDRSRSGTMASSHIAVALSDGSSSLGVSVLTVHVVRSRSRVVSYPDTKVLHNSGGFLSNLFHRDDLSGSLVDLLVVGNEIPESRFGSDWVGSKKSHTVDRSVGLSG